jgi:malonyl CoA-acyl carrier protein transacylase
MGEVVYFKVYAKLSDGSYVYSEVAGYSAAVYAKTILKKEASQSKALVVALMNYGAEAQKFFGQTEDLMNEFLTAEQQALVKSYEEITIADTVKADAAKVGVFAKNDGFVRGYPSVSFEGTFAINYYFQPKYEVEGEMKLYYWTAEAYASAEVLTAENASGCMVMTEGEDGIYGASYTAIAAKQIEDTLYVAVVYENGGNTYATGVIDYSLGTYCKQIAAKSDSEMQDLAKATAVYGSYAKEFFGK